MSVTPGAARERSADRRSTRLGSLGRLGTLHPEVLGALNYHRSDKLGRYDWHTLA